jgi:hypothetical protein
MTVVETTTSHRSGAPVMFHVSADLVVVHYGHISNDVDRFEQTCFVPEIGQTHTA